jgi:UDP-N-acetyl-D-mannosaminuronate dehydrogenase
VDDLKKPLISVASFGCVGLCTAVSFATKGCIVTASDVDRERIAEIREGIPRAENALEYSRALVWTGFKQ